LIEFERSVHKPSRPCVSRHSDFNKVTTRVVPAELTAIEGDRLARRRARQGPGGSHRYPEPGGEHCADYRFNYSLAIGGDGWLTLSIASSAEPAAGVARTSGRILAGTGSK